MSAPSPDPADPPPRPPGAGRRGYGADAAAPPHRTASAGAANDHTDRGGGARRTPARVVKDILLFFAAPFVTLAYLVLFPFIAVRLLMQARRERQQTG